MAKKKKGGSTSDGSSKKKGGSTSDESSKKKGGSTSDGSSKKKGGSTSEGSSKKTGKGKTKKQVRLSIKPKKPSKKSLLQKQVTQLEEELAGVSKDLGEREVQLKEVRGKHGRELESKEACVEHLGRVLRRKTEELAEVQDRLQWVRDLTELMQQRAYDLKRSIDRNRQVKKSIFLQQYAELEDKLSRLEEVRLKRNSQLAHLKRVDDNLQVKTNVDRGEKREDNKMHVRNMLQKREEFENLMDNIGSNSMDVFQLSLPVYARQQLDDNIYLRQKCESISEDLLRLQEHSRHLKEVRNNLDLEMETQNSTEAKLIELDSSLGGKKNSLLTEVYHLQQCVTVEVSDLKVLESDIRKVGRKMARASDKLANAVEVLCDQKHYRDSLEYQVRRKEDWKGMVMSKILRAGSVVKAKVKEVQDKESRLDWDLLKQIRMLLENEDKCLAEKST